MLTAYASYFALFYFAAAGQLTFSSDNRSTPLRIVMLVQFLLFTGWMTWGIWTSGGLHGATTFGGFITDLSRLLRSALVRDGHALVRRMALSFAARQATVAAELPGPIAAHVVQSRGREPATCSPWATCWPPSWFP